MKIFGYNHDKQVRQIDIPVQTLLDKQIDPWRVDLFDSEPVALRIDEEELFFSKLRNIAFTYWLGDKATVCMLEDSQAACLESDQFEYDSKRMSLRNARQSALPLSEHLKSLYKLTDQCWASWNCIKGAWFGVAKSHADVTLSGSNVDLRQSYPDQARRYFGNYPKFAGEMFRTMPISIALPAKVNWLFETFKDVQPLLQGSHLRQALAERDSFGAIEFCIDPEQETKFRDLGQSVPGIKFIDPERFMYEGHTYGVFMAKPALTAEVIRDPNDHEFWHGSVDGVYATAANQVHATRIALFDISRFRMRAVSVGSQTRETSKTSIKLEIPAGWSLEPTIFLDKKLNQTPTVKSGE